MVTTLRTILAVFVIIAVSACERLDDHRLPPAAVYISFPTVAQWDTYGVSGALSWKRFIKQDRVPADFPWTAASYTGFGGVLLVGTVMGAPAAYDLACPVECKQSVRVYIDTEQSLAVCPVCGSTYDVFSLSGHPVSGPAAQDGYGLTRYNVLSGQNGEYMLITNR